MQRIINGGGRIERKYGFGRKRTDLLVIWFYEAGQVQEVVLELKIKYGKLETLIDQGLAQTWDDMDQCGTSEGHLIIFDRGAEKTWAEKIFREARVFEGQEIVVWGM